MLNLFKLNYLVMWIFKRFWHQIFVTNKQVVSCFKIAKQFILSTSPIYGQQIAIPIEEFDRLKKKFIEYKSTNFKKPEIIILEKLEPLTQKIVIKKQNYCKLYDGNIYILYLKKNPIRNEWYI